MSSESDVELGRNRVHIYMREVKQNIREIKHIEN